MTISAKEWEFWKPEIQRLYCVEEFHLKRVLYDLQKQGFFPTEGQVRGRLKSWNMRKPSRKQRMPSKASAQGKVTKYKHTSSQSSYRKLCPKTSPHSGVYQGPLDGSKVTQMRASPHCEVPYQWSVHPGVAGHCPFPSSGHTETTHMNNWTGSYMPSQNDSWVPSSNDIGIAHTYTQTLDNTPASYTSDAYARPISSTPFGYPSFPSLDYAPLNSMDGQGSTISPSTSLDSCAPCPSDAYFPILPHSLPGLMNLTDDENMYTTYQLNPSLEEFSMEGPTSSSFAFTAPAFDSTSHNPACGLPAYQPTPMQQHDEGCNMPRTQSQLYDILDLPTTTSD
ncbi:hypothetical protein KEM56_005906 [Ascosphaera pollenicola]|nr:hypothetical protein KEM56_005906 [Ascosphaera pollenicola]